MALHPDFPPSPYAELLPQRRWFPAAEELRSTRAMAALDLPQKMKRLAQWCVDANAAHLNGGPNYGFVYVDQEGSTVVCRKSFAGLATSFRDFQSPSSGS